MRAIMVSVDYNDILAITLPWNRHHFDEVYVVTSTADYDNVKAIADPNNAMVIATDLFYADGAVFNKFRSLEYGLDVMGRHGWLCIMDADILWPKKVPIKPAVEMESYATKPEFSKYLRCGYLYTPLRRMVPWPMPTVPSEQCKKCFGSGNVYSPHNQDLNPNNNGRVWGSKIPCDCHTPSIPSENEWQHYPIHRNTKEWAGYSQIFHAEDPALGKPPWYDISWSHAGGADSAFQHKWTQDRKIRPNFEVLHLGPAGVNWYGRATPYADGTIHPDADTRSVDMDNLWRSRRVRPSATRFLPEKIQIDT